VLPDQTEPVLDAAAESTDHMSNEMDTETPTLKNVTSLTGVPAAPARRKRGGHVAGSARRAARLAPVANTHRWTEADLRKEKARLVAYLEDRDTKELGVPCSLTRPDRPSTTLIAHEAKVRRSAISLETGHLKATLDAYVKRMELKPYDGATGFHFHRSDLTHEALASFIERRKAAGLRLPSVSGRPNMAALARAAGIGADTLTDKSHRNHRLVMEQFASMNLSVESAKISRTLLLGELLKMLEA
jgi:hypothetical protein